MKFGAKPRESWKTPAELGKKYNKLNVRFNRLMILEHVWAKLVGEKEKFWKLSAVKGGILYVSVRLSVARSELTGRRENLIRELNKHFDKPWIEKIEIVNDLGAIHD